MNTATQTIEVPQVVFDYWKPKKVAQKKILETLVLKLVKEGNFTQGKAAELLGVSRWDFQELSPKYDVPTVTFDSKELEKQVHDAERLKI